MNKLFTSFLAATGMLCVGTGFTSCTVSEPDEISAGAGHKQLESINASFMPVVKFSYDSRNRLSEIKLGNDERVEFSYDPMQITMYEYDERYNYETELDEMYLSDLTVLHNIKLNAAGCITSYDTRDTRYNQTYDYETGGYIQTEETETFSSTVTYNSNGYITAIYNSDGDGDSHFTWNGDRLTSYNDGETTMSYTYMDISNPYQEWNPLVTGPGMILYSGLFGPAAAWQVESVKVRGPYDSYDEKYAYRMFDNGQISQMKYSDEDGDVLTVTFKYRR